MQNCNKIATRKTTIGKLQNEYAIYEVIIQIEKTSRKVDSIKLGRWENFHKAFSLLFAMAIKEFKIISKIYDIVIASKNAVVKFFLEFNAIF